MQLKVVARQAKVIATCGLSLSLCACVHVCVRACVGLCFSGCVRACVCMFCTVGFYMYIETSFPRQTGDVARFISPRYGPPNNAPCNLTFWYHMYGASTGTLNVIARPASSNFTIIPVVVFTLSGNQGNSWKRASVSLNKVTYSYNVRLVLSISACPADCT